MFGAFEDPVTWCRDSGIRWLSDPSDLNLALRELPKAHAQKKRNVGSLTARRSKQGFFLSFSDRRFACIGCGKPCGPYRASPWRWPAASSLAKSPACEDWVRGSGNPEAAARPRRPHLAGSVWATD